MDVTQTPATVPPPADTPTVDASVISSDFDTFLKMMTAQIQNQDPLNPIDSADYAVQLATFSSVEQQVQTNELLTSLSAQLTSQGMAEMASWVGKEARTAAPAHWDGTTPVTLSPNPLAVADRTALVVRDQWGTEVRRQDIPVSAEPIQWSGAAPGQTPLPTGLYSFELVNYSNGDLLSQDPVEIYARVEEIQSINGETVLSLAGGTLVPATAVTALRNPA